MTMDEIRLLFVENNKERMIAVNTLIHKIETPHVRLDWLVDDRKALEHLDEYRHHIDVVLYAINTHETSVKTIGDICDKFPELALIVISEEDEAAALRWIELGAQDVWHPQRLNVERVRQAILFSHGRQQKAQRLRELAGNSSQLEQRLNSIIQNDRDSLLVVDQNGMILYSNPMAEKLFKRSASELFGAVFGIPVAGASSDPVRVIITDAPDKNIEMSVTMIWWEKQKAWLCRLRDMTQYHMAQEMMKENEEKFKAIASGARDAIIHVNEQQNIAFINEAVVTLFGGEYADILNKPFHEIFNRQHDLTGLVDKAREEHRDQQREIHLIRADGSNLPVDISVSVFKRKGKRQLVCILRDISERRRTQFQLMQTQTELKEALENLKANQRKMMQMEKLNSIKELAGALAHEFAQPLQALYNYLHLIQTSDAHEVYFQKSREMLNRISDLTGSLKNITSLRKKDYLDSQIIDLFASSAPISYGNGTRVLIIDDEQEILETLIDIFNNAGYVCKGAADGRDALQVMEISEFDLIISDVMMPRMSGPTFFRRIRDEGYTGFFIFLTGYEHPDEERKLMAEADAVIHKPVSFNELLSKVETVLMKAEVNV